MKFSNEKTKEAALSIHSFDSTQIHSPSESFFLLIHGVKEKDLDIFLKYVLDSYLEISPELNLTLEDCYNITQNLSLNKTEKEIIYNLAIKCVKEKTTLGSNIILNNINTSSWISHSINAAQVCKILAEKTNLDASCAETLGLLHDYGRKFSHSFDHTIIGFEELLKLGWTQEAIACLTHSFLNGGRCSNNEPAVEGFYVDKDGNPQWRENAPKDDFTLFLESYNYSPYDYLLNIADLTAIEKGIVPPHIRVADIATRRNIDPTNRSYFLCDLINTLIKLLNDCNSNTKDFQYIKATPDMSLETIGKYFIEVSNEFYTVFFDHPKKTKKVAK